MNLVIYLATVILYWFLWYLLSNKADFPKAKRAALVALFCLPININGYVFTVFGNGFGERGMFSVASVYQNTEGTAYSGLGLFQTAEGDAITIIGISGYQRAGGGAATLVGISGYQRAGGDAVTGAGISGYQRAGGDAATLVGISGYQRAGGDAITLVGISGYQRARGYAVTVIGCGIYQRAENTHGMLSRSFGAWSSLHAPKK